MLNWVEELRRRPEEVISGLYKEFRNEAIAWLHKNYRLEKEDALDVFQNAITAVYQNVMLNKVNFQGVAIKTYLFSICKNLAIKLKTKRKLNTIDVFEIPEMSDERENAGLLESQLKKCVETIELLSSTCVDLLKSFYLKGQKIPEITKVYQYSSENSAKTQKYKCLKKLRELMTNSNLA